MRVFSWVFAIFSILGFFSNGIMDAESSIDIRTKKELLYQLEISSEVPEFLSDLFQRFSDGYIEPDSALDKIAVMQNEYINTLYPPNPEGEKLYELMNRLFSQIEHYFINYKMRDRENAFINFKIAKTKFDIKREVARIKYLL